jgi:hypothetical protein
MLLQAVFTCLSTHLTCKHAEHRVRGHSEAASWFWIFDPPFKNSKRASTPTSPNRLIPIRCLSCYISFYSWCSKIELKSGKPGVPTDKDFELCSGKAEDLADNLCGYFQMSVSENLQISKSRGFGPFFAEYYFSRSYK